MIRAAERRHPNNKMAKKEKEYQKLPGTKKGFLIGRYTLWQAADHLLHIYSRVGVEDYKRFYFNDIQAIVTRKTITGKVLNFGLGILLLLFTLPAILNDGGWSLFWTALSGVFLILLLINLYRGPTCETKLLTAVQTEKLQSLHRLKNAFKVMDSLGSQIQSVQGRLSREDLGKKPNRLVNSNRAKGPSMKPGKSNTPIRKEKGRAHLILFGLLVMDGMLAITGFFSAHVIATILGAVTGICTGIFVIIALVKQNNSDMPHALQTMTWISLGYVVISFIAGYIITLAAAFKNPGIAYNQWELFQSISHLSPRENPLLLSYEIFTICGALFLGLPGLFMLKRSGHRINETSAKRVAPSHRPVVSAKSAAGVQDQVS